MWRDPFKLVRQYEKKNHIIDESLCRKLCHTNKFNNSKELLGHLTAKALASSPYFVHCDLLVYLE